MDHRMQKAIEVRAIKDLAEAGKTNTELLADIVARLERIEAALSSPPESQSSSRSRR